MTASIPGSHREAVQLGTTHYFTGAPCKKGHIAPRYTIGHTCLECSAETSRRHHPRRSLRHNSSPEEIAAAARVYLECRSITKVAETLGIKRPQAYERVRRSGVYVPRFGTSRDSLPGEEWRPIAGFQTCEVSCFGRIRKACASPKFAAGTLLQTWVGKDGRPAVRLHIEGRRGATRHIHTLVCAAFHGERPSLRHYAAHLDGDRHNNRADNLRWSVVGESCGDAVFRWKKRRASPRVARVAIKCEACAKDFTVLPGVLRHRKVIRYCSAKCSVDARMAASAQPRRRPGSVASCAACGENFIVPKKSSKRYCSQKCVGLAHRVPGAKWRDPEQIRQYMAEYNAKNKERLTPQKLAYQREHPEQKQAIMRNRRAAAGRISADEWSAVLEMYGHRCLCCGAADVKLTMDHVVALATGGRHSVDNVQPLCFPCNRKKSKKTIDYRPQHRSVAA